MANSFMSRSSISVSIACALSFVLAAAFIALNAIFLAAGTRYTSTTTAVEPDTNFTYTYSGTPNLSPFSVGSFTFEAETLNGTTNESMKTFRETYYLCGVYLEDLTTIPHASEFIWKGRGTKSGTGGPASNSVSHVGFAVGTWDSSTTTALLEAAIGLLAVTLVWAPVVALPVVNGAFRSGTSYFVAVLTAVALVLQAVATADMQRWVSPMHTYPTSLVLSDIGIGRGIVVAWVAFGLGVPVVLLEVMCRVDE